MMDLSITNTILGALLLGIGWVFKTFWGSWKEAREGRKEEAQRIASDRDKYKGLVWRWRKACYATQVVAIKAHVPEDQLPSTPDDDTD